MIVSSKTLLQVAAAFNQLDESTQVRLLEVMRKMLEEQEGSADDGQQNTDNA